jgi:hypothetical protein
MNKSKQRGCAHAVIIIVLVLTIIVLLGYVFWQNFVDKKEDMPGQSSSIPAEATEPEDATKELKKLTINEGVGVDISFSYPEDWNVERSYNEDSERPSESVNLESPSGKVSIYYYVGPGGVGGNCDPAYVDKVGFVQSENIPGLNMASFSEIIFKSDDKYRLSATGAVTKKYISDVKVDDLACSAYLINFVDLKETSEYLTTMNAVIHIKGVTGSSDNLSYSSIDEIRSIFEEKEYKEAKAIIVSTVYKE